ncbi:MULTISPECIES: TIGR00730 family Rossman fold protein [Streptomyces]|uniref:LOG family protein n=1 Tax=Streptomyces TaxID=1883 RepID=UPI000BF210C3|nr:MULTISPECIES: TIGR00730 family Rossman fold protein [unclassified Streptomyces]WTE24397.1 TIGR00730 family Rossman fold protein [Streptomyces anulatus]
MRITVFLSSNSVPEHYQRAAEHLGRLFGESGHTVVWGGTDLGLMKVLIDAAEEAGGKSEGVSVGFLERYIRPGSSMVIAQSLADRKEQLLANTDAVVVVAGGTGTLDEATDAIELRRHGMTSAPLIFLNTDGFYSPLQELLSRMEEEDFLNVPLADVATFVETPEEVIEAILRSTSISGRTEESMTIESKPS